MTYIESYKFFHKIFEENLVHLKGIVNQLMYIVKRTGDLMSII